MTQRLDNLETARLVAEVAENDRDDVDQAIVSSFGAYTRKFVPDYKSKPFKIYIEDQNKQIIAGLMGILFVGYDCWVHLVSVDLHYHRLGLGTKLFQKLEEYALEYNCTNIRLETSEIYSKELYEKLGFSQIAEVSDGYLGYTAYIMRKYLK